MSAFVVDSKDVQYLVQAAATWRCLDIYHDGARHTFTPTQAGQMLWDENIRSVTHRYPADPLDLPGTIGDAPYIYEHPKNILWLRFDAVQVLKAIGCLEYQSCEHPEWPASMAAAFLTRLQSEAIRHLPGYEDAEWGAPETYTQATTI